MYKKCNIIYIPHYNVLCFNQKFCSRMCDKVLGNDTSLWEDEVYNFAKNHQLRVSTNTAKNQFYYIMYCIFIPFVLYKGRFIRFEARVGRSTRALLGVLKRNCILNTTSVATVTMSPYHAPMVFLYYQMLLLSIPKVLGSNPTWAGVPVVF